MSQILEISNFSNVIFLFSFLSNFCIPIFAICITSAMGKMDRMVYGKTKDTAKLALNGRHPMSRSFTATAKQRKTTLRFNTKKATKERTRKEHNRLRQSFSGVPQAYGKSIQKKSKKNSPGSSSSFHLSRSVLRDPMLR